MTDSALPGGLLTGVVIDLEDPEVLGRIRVEIPAWDDRATGWARLVAPGAGADRGLFFRPDVGDEVLVGFEAGDLERPLILGGLWSILATPPRTEVDPAANNWRMLTSRGPYMLKFDDTTGSQSVELSDDSQAQRVVLDDSAKSVTIESGEAVRVSTHSATIQLENGTLSVSARDGARIEILGGTLRLSAAGDVEIEAGGNLTLKAGRTLSVQGDAVQIKGGIVDIN